MTFPDEFTIGWNLSRPLSPKLFKISFPLINLSANFFLVIILFTVVLQDFYNDSASRCRPCVLRAVFLLPFSGETSCLLLPDHLLFNRCNIIYARVWFHYQFLVGISVYSAHIGLHCYFSHCYVYFSQSWRCGALVMVLFVRSEHSCRHSGRCPFIFKRCTFIFKPMASVWLIVWALYAPRCKTFSLVLLQI